MTRRFYEEPEGGDGRRSAPAALRNVGPIGDVLADWLPDRGTVLELASGTGEHALAFSRRFPGLRWQPSDASADALRSIVAWQADGPPNLLAPIELDAASEDWGDLQADAIVAINLVHISPWPTSIGLLAGSERLLAPGVPLILYGPWMEEGVDTVPSNLAFDADLRARDPRWGLRRVADFTREAEQRDLFLAEHRPMPANNIMLRFIRR
ncbi:MAG: DUF938 domain-containing protein [Sphingomicrobium sp.]|nr:class I SAM-dependent methyltransferase [Sphingomonadales bacterium]